jgi:hypothetical protein
MSVPPLLDPKVLALIPTIQKVVEQVVVARLAPDVLAAQVAPLVQEQVLPLVQAAIALKAEDPALVAHVAALAAAQLQVPADPACVEGLAQLLLAKIIELVPATRDALPPGPDLATAKLFTHAEANALARKRTRAWVLALVPLASLLAFVLGWFH